LANPHQIGVGRHVPELMTSGPSASDAAAAEEAPASPPSSPRRYLHRSVAQRQA
jgi:hypothetical protein